MEIKPTWPLQETQWPKFNKHSIRMVKLNIFQYYETIKYSYYFYNINKINFTFNKIKFILNLLFYILFSSDI